MVQGLHGKWTIVVTWLNYGTVVGSVVEFLYQWIGYRLSPEVDKWRTKSGSIDKLLVVYLRALHKEYNKLLTRLFSLAFYKSNTLTTTTISYVLSPWSPLSVSLHLSVFACVSVSEHVSGVLYRSVTVIRPPGGRHLLFIHENYTIYFVILHPSYYIDR